MNKVIKSLLLAVATTTLIFSQTVSAEQKIGVVNFQQIVQTLPQTAEIIKALGEEFKDQGAELEKLKGDITFDQEKLKRDGALMSEKDKKELEKKIALAYRQFQEKGQTLQQQSQQRQNEETNKIVALVRQTVDTLAAKEGFDLIIDASAAPYVNPELDISKKVFDKVSKLK